jgi:hypothetical protein
MVQAESPEAKGTMGKKLKMMLMKPLRAMCLTTKQRILSPIELPAGLQDGDLVRNCKSLMKDDTLWMHVMDDSVAVEIFLKFETVLIWLLKSFLNLKLFLYILPYTIYILYILSVILVSLMRCMFITDCCL